MFQLPKLYVIFVPKIIEIRKCSFKLQLKMSGVFFFETQCRVGFVVPMLIGSVYVSF